MIGGLTVTLRFFVTVVGLIGTWWGLSEFSTLRQQVIIDNVGKRIIAGDPFKTSTLLNQASLAEQVEDSAACRPLILRSIALIRLRIAEISDDAGLGPAPVRNSLAAEAIRKSLSCSPAEPFFWLVLFALDPSAQLNYLSESYRLGPNEGWIALKRNPIAFAEFNDLTNDLRATVVHEFLMILEMGLYDDAMKIFVGPAWDQKDLILSHMDLVSRRHRQKLADLLAAAGYDVIVPGTAVNVTH